MNLRIGNQTAFSARSVLEPFDFALTNGFDAFEFFPDRGFSGVGGWQEKGLDDATRRYIRQAAASCNITLTVHAPLEFNPLQAPENNRLRSTIELAKDLGATLVNLHLDISQGAGAFAKALEPAMRLTAASGLKLALENTVWTGPEDFNVFFAVLRQTQGDGAKHVGMCFDLGHANLFGGLQNNYWAYIDALAREVPLIHLHLHENFGDRDSHLPLFTGPSRDDPSGLVGLVERLEGRVFKGCAILEQWPQPPSLLVDARTRFRELIQSRG